MKLFPNWYVPPHIRKRQRRSAAAVVQAVTKEFNIDKETLVGNSRQRKVSRARHVAWYVMSRNCAHMSYPQMARMLNRIDHSTAIHGVKTVEHLVAVDDEFAAAVERVEMALRD